ncbi:MAG TPA: patatin-like phospholipase family protein [Candidatus Angelobacter sp.]|jgi:predicted acylesterase/phospholipase RssA|nr:patatin-like phospholipase family protein [Candidatus Angelobacter sp.]
MNLSMSAFHEIGFVLRLKSVALLILTCLLVPTDAYADAARQPIVIKIGVSEYQTIEATYQDHQKFFYVLSVLSGDRDQSGAVGNSAVFEISVGSYDEVVDWWNKGQIDAAVLSATPVATLLASSTEEVEKLKKSYIGTLGERHRENDPERPLLNAFCGKLPESECQDTLSRQRKVEGARYFYRSLALVNADHVTATGFNDVSRANPTYLFVRPASASGYLVPFTFLKKTLPQGKAILGGAKEDNLTYQHANSVIKLLQSDKPTVAFIYDSVRISGDQKEIIAQARTKLRKLLGTDYLDTTLIPFNALFVNYNRPKEIYLRNMKILQKALNRFKGEASVGNSFTRDYRKTGDFTFKRFDDWISKYDEMVKIIKDPPPGWSASAPVLFSASQIGDELYHYSDCKKDGTCERLPRLAVVLSGGGAKCAYQAGALESIEEVLDKRRHACEKETPDNKYCNKIFDIDVLVGTSGGSINALLAAAGNTNTANGRLNMEHVWGTLNQNDLVEPSARLKLWLAASFGMLQAFCLALLVGLFATGKWSWLALVDLLLIFCVVLLSIIFFVSGGRFVPVALVVQLVLVAGIVAIKPVNRFIQKLLGKHRARAMLLVLLVESIVFAHIHGELNYSTTGMLLGTLLTGAVIIALVAGLTRYLVSLQAVNTLKCARVFAALCAMVLALLRFVIVDLHPPVVQGTSPIASTLLRLVPFTPDIPASYAIPINTGLIAQLLLFVYLVIIDFETGKLRKIKDWRFYAVVAFMVIATWLPIPQQSGGRKDLVMTSAHVVGALFLLQATVWLAFFILGRSLKKGPMHWWMAASATMFFISVAEFCIALVWVLMDYWSPPLGHWILHLGLLFIKLLIFRWVLATPVLIGLAMLLTPLTLNWLQVSWDWNQHRALAIGALAGITAVVSALVTGVLFFLEVSVSESTAIAKTFSESMPSVVAGLKAPIDNPIASNAPCSGDPDLCNISRQIIAGSSIRRDLLITASRLHEHHSGVEALPDDLYFYFKRSSHKVPLDARFVSFAKNPHLLLDAVIGSSTIYPVFPPRKLRQVCLQKDAGSGFKPENEVDIIDGGFIHNSPIEAAVSWGATHIVLIEASPDDSPQPAEHFGQHVAKAFDYLFSQAQRTDVSSKGSVELFELRPENSMDVLDFSPKLLQRAINDGKEDAGGGAGVKPRFHRIARAPAFREQYQPSSGDAPTLSPDEQDQSFSDECREKNAAAAEQKSSHH